MPGYVWFYKFDEAAAAGRTPPVISSKCHPRICQQMLDHFVERARAAPSRLNRDVCKP